jgi:flagella basal body P-ring formation protein FlgA
MKLIPVFRPIFRLVFRLALLGAAWPALSHAATFAPGDPDAMVAPVLRGDVTVIGDLVRIGDLVDNAGTAAQIAIYRAPDLGTTGSLPTAKVIEALRAHQVIGVDTRDLRTISVRRLARTLDVKEIELQVAHALEHRGGLGDSANLTLTFDHDLQDMQLEVSNSGAIQPAAAHYEPRTGRFDVSLEIANDNTMTPTRLRFTGIAVETVEAAVPARTIERGEVIKASDVLIERRPKNEIGGEPALRDHVIGMQARRQLRAGQALRTADIAKADLVVRDETVTLIFEAPGLYLTIRGKAVDSGTEGDIVNVVNLTSQRIVSGVVVGRGQVSISAVSPRISQASSQASNAGSSSAADEPAAAASVAASAAPSVAAKAE